jgi:hypothetical protein
MDREWMYVANQVSQHFFYGLETFLEATAKYNNPEDMFVGHYICCPCVDCYNEKMTSDIEKIHEHLMARGFMSGYTCWIEHGEHKEVVREGHSIVEEDQDKNVMVEDNDMAPDNNVDDLDEMFRDVDDEFACKCESKSSYNDKGL